MTRPTDVIATVRVPLNVRMRPDKYRNPSYRSSNIKQPQPRRPTYAWMPGNSVFRRYANGQLDFNYACSKVLEAMHRKAESGYLNADQKAALSIIIPGLEMLMPPELANTLVRISKEEIARLRLLLQRRKNEILNYNAGYGGGTSDRTFTYA